jgi:hypothetical protein
MNERERLEELIPAYLDDRLSPDDRTRMEAALREDAKLREEVAEQRRLLVGLDLLAEVRGEHIDSELLALYADADSDLDDSERDEIDAHLKQCHECREELELCLKVVALPERGTSVPRASWIQILVDKLFPVSFAVRPVVVYATLLMVMFGVYYVWDRDRSALVTAARFELSSVEVRGEAADSILILEPHHEVLVLDLVLPTREGQTYDLTLVDVTGSPVLTYHAIPHALPLTVEVPATAVSAGDYVWHITESGTAGAPPDTIWARFAIEYAR